MWKRDSALRVSLTNLELLKSLLRRRRVNFGKKKALFEKLKTKKNPIPSHTEKKFHDFYFEEKKSPITTTYWLLVILPNSTLSVFNKKQQQMNQQTYKKQQKNTFYLIHSLFFWTLYNNSVFTISYFTSVLHYSLLFS